VRKWRFGDFGTLFNQNCTSKLFKITHVPIKIPQNHSFSLKIYQYHSFSPQNHSFSPQNPSKPPKKNQKKTQKSLIKPPRSETDLTVGAVSPESGALLIGGGGSDLAEIDWNWGEKGVPWVVLGAKNGVFGCFWPKKRCF
jgi:hypothetical protein